MSILNSCYDQIHYGERQIIERLVKEGYKPGKIARNIFRSRSTVWREIRRNGCELKDGSWHYDALLAQIAHNMRQRGRKHSLFPKKPTLIRDDNWRNGYKDRKYYPPVCKKSELNNKFIHWKKYRDRFDKEPVDATNYWAETYFAKRWRKHYNRLIRIREYDREEFYRPFRKCSYDKNQYGYRSPYAVHFGYSRYIPFLKRNSSRRRRIAYSDLLFSSEKQAGWESSSFSSIENLHPKRIHKKNNAYAFLMGFPLLHGDFQKAQGTTMSKSQQFLGFFKIPANFQKGSPRSFLKSG